MYESHLFARCTAHHAVLYWDKPAAARAQQTYTVYLNNQQTATTDRTHYTLGGLEPQTEYRVDVLCGDQPVGACLLRIVWIMTIFQWERTQLCLYISYPVSWGLTTVVHLICFLVLRKKVRAQTPEEPAAAAA